MYSKKNLITDITILSWIIALIGTVGSLYFSEVQQIAPCVLCWYQRIALYPLVILIPLGLWKKQSDIFLTILALTIPGAVVSMYHNLLVWGVIPEDMAPCVQGISCTTQVFSLFGFITIPLLALGSFFALIGGALVVRHLQRLHS